MGDKTKLTPKGPAPTSSLDELIAKAPVAKLKEIQSLFFKEISSAASNHDVAKVAELSSLAKECETLEIEIAAFKRRAVEALKNSLNGSRSLSTASVKSTVSTETTILSPKSVAAQERNEWVTRIQTKGISLHGHGKQYQTASGQSVAVAFSNERRGDPWPWFLGLRDELPDVAVLLCKSHEGTLYDIVLPASPLRKVWHVLKRSYKSKHVQVKFNVDRKADRFLLRVPDDDPLDIGGYIGNYAPLR